MIINGGLNPFGKFIDLFAGGIAIIDQDEGLLFVHPIFAKPLALPATNFDQPTSRQFDLPIGGRIVGDFVVHEFDLLKMFLINDRVFEKRTCISNLFGIGELAGTDFDDLLADFLYAGEMPLSSNALATGA